MRQSTVILCVMGALIGGLICPTAGWLYRPFYFPLNLNYLFPTAPTTTTTTTTVAPTTTTAAPTTTTRTTPPPVQVSAGFISGQLAAQGATLGGYPFGYPGLGTGGFYPGAQLGGGGVIGGIARPPFGGIAGGVAGPAFGQFGGGRPYPVIGGLASPNGK